MPNPLAAALEAFRKGDAELERRHFLPTGIYVQRLKDRMKKKDRVRARKLIRSENADAIIDRFPAEEFEVTHAITGGNFVMGDLVARVFHRFGSPRRLDIATLSLSEKNVRMLADLIEAAPPEMETTLLLSYYFQTTNQEIYRAIETLLLDAFPPPRFRITVARSHAKIFLFDFADGPQLVIETSANLRSSNNIEQMTAFNSRELLLFHRDWIESVVTRSADAE